MTEALLRVVPSTSNNMVALVRIKSQYGQNVIIPMNAVAHEFAQIAGTKLLTQKTVDSMKRLGYTVAVEQTLPATL